MNKYWILFKILNKLSIYINLFYFINISILFIYILGKNKNNCVIRKMPSSTITVQVGQCGNQLGMAFWERMCVEHGITPEGQVTRQEDRQKSDDCKEIFFHEANCGQKWVPRAVLVDLEPRVLSEICNYDLNQYSMLFDVDNIYQGPTGGGAGNNWACGFNQGADAIEDIMTIVEMEAEKADHLECFAICHSIMGGTGSGLGSRILQELRDRFGKKIIQTYSTLQPMTCNVQVAPYNIVLSLDTIMEHADMCLLFDNDAFEKQCKGVNPLQRFRTEGTHEDLTNLGAIDKKNYSQINSMMSQVMTSLTAPIRFYSPVYSRIMHISAMINPFPPMIFSQSAFVPHVSIREDSPKQQLIKYPDPRTVLSFLLDPRQLISSSQAILKRQKEGRERAAAGKEKTADNEKQPQKSSPKPQLFPADQEHRLISGFAILQSTEMDPLMKLAGTVAPGGVPIADLYQHIRTRNQTQKYVYNTMNLTCCRLSPHMPHEQHPITGLLVANHTSVGVCLNSFGSDFEKMWKRKANVHAFEQSFVGNFEEKMGSSKENLDALLQLYKEACSNSFMDFDLEQMERENITPIRQQHLSSSASTDLTLTS